MKADLTITSAGLGDAAALARLAGQLGYPSSPETIRSRMAGYLDDPERAILTARADGEVVGWLSLDVASHFYAGDYAEISGFVVDERYRSRGIGKAMLDAAESWARERGLPCLRLRTNAIRKDAHRFYERNGFTKVKQQLVYQRVVAG